MNGVLPLKAHLWEKHSHMEAVANSLVGAGLAQGVLWMFGIPTVEALSLNVAMIVVSYARSFALRRVFARLG